MTDRAFTVDVTRGVKPSLETETSEITVTDSFTIGLRGHDTPSRVHCRLDDTLARIARIEEVNYLVEPGTERLIEVDLEEPSEAVSGTLELAVGYGAESIAIDVTVAPKHRPAVEESLGEPKRRQPDPSPVVALARSLGVEPQTVVVAVLAVVAVVVSLASTMIVGGTVGTLGSLVVLVGVLIAVVLLVRE